MQDLPDLEDPSTNSEDALYDAYLRTVGTWTREEFLRRRHTGPILPVPRPFGQNESQQRYNSRPSETPQAGEPSLQNEIRVEILPPYWSPNRSLAPVIVTSQSGYVMDSLPPYDLQPSKTPQAGEPSPQRIAPDNFTQHGSPSNSMGESSERF